jgi:hypothetical protein
MTQFFRTIQVVDAGELDQADGLARGIYNAKVNSGSDVAWGLCLMLNEAKNSVSHLGPITSFNMREVQVAAGISCVQFMLRKIYRCSSGQPWSLLSMCSKMYNSLLLGVLHAKESDVQ